MALVLALHVLAALAIIRAFTPQLASRAFDRAMEALTVVITTPEPDSAKPAQAAPGAAAAPAPKAAPRPVSAPKKVVPRDPRPMPPVAGAGTRNAAGAASMGPGTGAGGNGTGTGSGGAGAGPGAGAARGVEKIEGDIQSARDYPRATRDARMGHSVTIVLAVGTDGRVSDCRISQPSPDPQADQITCALAAQRFRFRPALDRQGNPVRGQYAWRQRWFQ